MTIDITKISKKKLRAALYWANMKNKQQAVRIQQLEETQQSLRNRIEYHRGQFLSAIEQRDAYQEACRSYERAIDRLDRPDTEGPL